MAHKSKKLYVAGHTGLIGSAVAKRLNATERYQVVTATHNEPELQDASAVLRFFESRSPDFAILAAGKVGGILENKTFPADFINANLAIQLNVLGAAHRASAEKLLLFASSRMYPRECPRPMSENRLFSGAPEPTSMAYTVSKTAGMQLCLAYISNMVATDLFHSSPTASMGLKGMFFRLRFGASIMPRYQEPKKCALGSGSPKREFIHTDDLADACVLLLEADTSQLQLPVNVDRDTI